MSKQSNHWVVDMLCLTAVKSEWGGGLRFQWPYNGKEQHGRMQPGDKPWSVCLLGHAFHWELSKLTIMIASYDVPRGLRTALDQGCTLWSKNSPVPTKMFHIPSKLSPIGSLHPLRRRCMFL